MINLLDDGECEVNDISNITGTMAMTEVTNKPRAEYGRRLYTPFFTSGSLQIVAALLLTAMYIYHRCVYTNL